MHIEGFNTMCILVHPIVTYEHIIANMLENTCVCVCVCTCTCMLSHKGSTSFCMPCHAGIYVH